MTVILFDNVNHAVVNNPITDLKHIAPLSKRDLVKCTTAWLSLLFVARAAREYTNAVAPVAHVQTNAAVTASLFGIEVGALEVVKLQTPRPAFGTIFALAAH